MVVDNQAMAYGRLRNNRPTRGLNAPKFGTSFQIISSEVIRAGCHYLGFTINHRNCWCYKGMIDFSNNRARLFPCNFTSLGIDSSNKGLGASITNNNQLTIMEHRRTTAAMHWWIIQLKICPLNGAICSSQARHALCTKMHEHRTITNYRSRAGMAILRMNLWRLGDRPYLAFPNDFPSLGIKCQSSKR